MTSISSPTEFPATTRSRTRRRNPWSSLPQMWPASPPGCETVEEWRVRLDEVLERGGHVVMWGGGSKAVPFLAAVGSWTTGVIVVDVNPPNQAKYLPGSAR